MARRHGVRYHQDDPSNPNSMPCVLLVSGLSVRVTITQKQGDLHQIMWQSVWTGKQLAWPHASQHIGLWLVIICCRQVVWDRESVPNCWDAITYICLWVSSQYRLVCLTSRISYPVSRISNKMPFAKWFLCGEKPKQRLCTSKYPLYLTHMAPTVHSSPPLHQCFCFATLPVYWSKSDLFENKAGQYSCLYLQETGRKLKFRLFPTVLSRISAFSRNRGRSTSEWLKFNFSRKEKKSLV